MPRVKIVCVKCGSDEINNAKYNKKIVPSCSCTCSFSSSSSTVKPSTLQTNNTYPGSSIKKTLLCDCSLCNLTPIKKTNITEELKLELLNSLQARNLSGGPEPTFYNCFGSQSPYGAENNLNGGLNCYEFQPSYTEQQFQPNFAPNFYNPTYYMPTQTYAYPGNEQNFCCYPYEAPIEHYCNCHCYNNNNNNTKSCQTSSHEVTCSCERNSSDQECCNNNETPNECQAEEYIDPCN